MYKFVTSEADLRPNAADCSKLQEQFIDLAVTEIVSMDPELNFAVEWVIRHINHELRPTMDLASVVATLGIVDENQVSTAGTISIMKNASKYCNLDGVSSEF